MISCALLKEALKEQLPAQYTCITSKEYLAVYTPIWITEGEPAKVFVRALDRENKLFRVTDRGETAKWLGIYDSDDTWEAHYYEIGTLARLNGVKVTDEQIIYADVPREKLAGTIQRVAQMSKDVLAFRLAADVIPAEKTRSPHLLDQVRGDLERYFPAYHIEQATVEITVEGTKKEPYALDIYIPEVKAVIQTIRDSNPNKVVSTLVAYRILADKSDIPKGPEITKRLVVFDGNVPEDFKRALRPYASLVERNVGTLQDVEAYRLSLEKILA